MAEKGKDKKVYERKIPRFLTGVKESETTGLLCPYTNKICSYVNGACHYLKKSADSCEHYQKQFKTLNPFEDDSDPLGDGYKETKEKRNKTKK